MRDAQDNPYVDNTTSQTHGVHHRDSRAMEGHDAGASSHARDDERPLRQLLPTYQHVRALFDAWELEVKRQLNPEKKGDNTPEGLAVKQAKHPFAKHKKTLKKLYSQQDPSVVERVEKILKNCQNVPFSNPALDGTRFPTFHDAQCLVDAEVETRQAAIPREFVTQTRSHWGAWGRTQDEARSNALRQYEADLRDGLRGAVAEAEASMHDGNIRRTRHPDYDVDLYHNESGTLMGISGKPFPRPGVPTGTKSLYNTLSPDQNPCAIGRRTMGGNTPNYVIYHNTSVQFSPETGSRSWVQDHRESLGEVKDLEALHISSVHTTVMLEPSGKHSNIGARGISVGTHDSHTTFNLCIQVEGVPTWVTSRWQYRPRVEVKPEGDGWSAKVSGLTMATDGKQEVWNCIDADPSLLATLPNSKHAAKREGKDNTVSPSEEEIAKGIKKSVYGTTSNKVIHEFAVAGYLMREDAANPRSYAEVKSLVRERIIEAIAQDHPINLSVQSQGSQSRPVTSLSSPASAFIAGLNSQGESPTSPVSPLSASPTREVPFFSCSTEAKENETVTRRDDDHDPDGDAGAVAKRLCLTHVGTQNTSTTTTQTQSGSTPTPESSGSTEGSSQAHESVETLRERLKRLHREELDFYTNAPELASPALSNFLNRMRAFHGEEMIALLEHSHVADTIFLSGSDADAKRILNALDCSVVRAEIRSEMLVHFLKNHAVDGLAHRGVALRTRFFQLLRRAFRAPDETVSGLLPELWTTHPKLYRYNENEILQAKTQSAFVEVREEAIRQAMVRSLRLRTTWLALFHEIQCAGKSNTIALLLDTMLPPLSFSLLSNRSVTVKECALLAKQVSQCFRFDTDADAKRSDRILKMILGDSRISKKYKFLVLIALKQHDPALEERYKTELDTKNKMKKSLRDFLRMKPCVDASHIITQESFARCVSLPPANVARSPEILKEASLSLMERVLKSDFLQDRVLLNTELETCSVPDDLLQEFSVPSKEAFIVYCDMSALSTNAKPERIEDEQEQWRALLNSANSQPQSTWYAEAEDHIAAHLDRLQTTIDTIVKEETKTFQKQLESDVKSDWHRDMKACRKELKRRYSSIPTSEIGRLVPLEPTKNQIRDIWCAVYNSELKQLLYESALSDINEKRWNKRLEIYTLQAQFDELDEHMDASSEKRRQTNQNAQKKIQDHAYQGAQKKATKKAHQEIQRKAAGAREDAQKRAQDRIRHNAVQKRAQEAARQEGQKRASEFARQESRKVEIAANERAEEAKRRIESEKRTENLKKTDNHTRRNVSNVSSTMFNYRGHSGDEYNRLGSAINEMNRCYINGRLRR